MYRPGDRDYNKDWDDLPIFRTNIETLIDKLEELRKNTGVILQSVCNMTVEADMMISCLFIQQNFMII